MYDLIIRNKKLNKLKVILVVLIVVLIILIILTSIKIVQMHEVSKSINEYNIWIEKFNEEKAKKDEEELKKYASLNEEELIRFDNIYKHQENKRVFLTFDDGPSTSVTPYILDLLKQENIKATFFVLGTKVEANPDILKREYNEGHFIANRS